MAIPAPQNEKINSLMAENAELKLYLAAIVRLPTAKGAISTEELRGMVTAIGAEDGQADGKYNGAIA